MGTIIKAIVNMVANTPITLSNRSIANSTAITVEPFSAKACNWIVPGCTSEGQLTAGFSLRLDLKLPPGFAAAGENLITHIWEQADHVRFMFQRASPISGYGSPTDYSINGFPTGNQMGVLARPLASHRNGGEFRVSGNPESILVVDERLWMICYPIGK